MYFVIHCSGACGSWKYIQEASSKDDAIATCRSTSARVISCNLATNEELKNAGIIITNPLQF
jgi:hypothetical protein